MPVSNIQMNPEIANLNLQRQTGTAAPGFKDHFAEFVKEANQEMLTAEEMTKAFARGENNNIHETMLAAERANVAFKLVGSIRSRVLDAYQEVMRMM